MKAMLKTKCGCKKIVNESLAHSAGSEIRIYFPPTPAEIFVNSCMDKVITQKYRAFKFKEVNKKNVAIYEEI